MLKTTFKNSSANFNYTYYKRANFLFMFFDINEIIASMVLLDHHKRPIKTDYLCSKYD